MEVCMYFKEVVCNNKNKQVADMHKMGGEAT